MSKSKLWSKTYQTMHSDLEDLFKAHKFALASYSFAEATWMLEVYGAWLSIHIELEEQDLMPIFERGGTQKHWPASTYLREHAKIRVLLALHTQQMSVDYDDPRDRLLACLESARRLQHLLEHHHIREEKSLFPTVQEWIEEHELVAVNQRAKTQWDSVRADTESEINRAKSGVDIRWQNLTQAARLLT